MVIRHPTPTPGQEWEAPFLTVGPFASADTGDLDLYTDMEISGLV